MNKIFDLVVRYTLIVILGLGNLFIFYKIFYPLTFYLSGFMLSMFGDIRLFYVSEIILYNQTAVSLIDACVAGSAYYLLFILALSIPNIKSIKRLKILVLSFSILLVVNIFRIVFMTLIARQSYFDVVHMAFWYALSLIFVICIWFFMVKIFNIKEIPIYSDYKFLLKQAKKTK